MKTYSQVIRVGSILVLCWLCMATPLLAQQRILLVGSGSSLAGPLLGVWGDEFHRHHPATKIAYVTTATNDGIRQINTLHEDFAIGETPLTAQQKNDANLRLKQLPIAVVTIVPVYNLPGKTELCFSGEVLAQIFMGHISNWNDPRIAALNPGVSLPDLAVTLVQRPEGTGSRFLFTEFLSQSSPEFRQWKRNAAHPEIVEGRSQQLTDRVASTPGAIGFVGWGFAEQAGLPYGRVQNHSGRFVKPSLESIRAASIAMQKLVFKDDPGPLLNAPGGNSYPITSFVWIYLPASGMAEERTRRLQEFLNWCLDEGQSLIVGHVYDRLPDQVASRARSKLTLLGNSISRPTTATDAPIP